MPKEKDLMAQAAARKTPKAIQKKRQAPAPQDLTKEDKAKRDNRWGVPMVVRVQQETRDALSEAASQYNV
ncbi:hypothetical protein LCGC14_2172010, partial [marine sediment metagenome]